MHDFHIDIDIMTNEIQNHLKVILSFFSIMCFLIK